MSKIFFFWKTVNGLPLFGLAAFAFSPNPKGKDPVRELLNAPVGPEDKPCLGGLSPVLSAASSTLVGPDGGGWDCIRTPLDAVKVCADCWVEDSAGTVFPTNGRRDGPPEGAGMEWQMSLTSFILWFSCRGWHMSVDFLDFIGLCSPLVRFPSTPALRWDIRPALQRGGLIVTGVAWRS